MLTVLIFVIILGLLVFVHELGHFITARWNGIKVDEFGFGFPPRIGGFVKDAETGKYRFILGDKEVRNEHTIYSVNWIPLGGFVRIEGEDGGHMDDPNSFARKPACIRVLVLAAGVLMNFFLAWVLFSVVFGLGLPQPIEESERGKYPDARVQIIDVRPGSPAADMGLQPGDAVVSIQGMRVEGTGSVSEAIAANKGREIAVDIDRFGRSMTLRGTPRVESPQGEGALGISFTETAVVAYPWYEAIWRGAQATYNVTVSILEAFGRMIASLFGAPKVPIDVTGPVGIVYMTKQMSDLGIAYLLQFAALLSINLGIINILPIPALDGGRILFVLIERLKGSPVSQKVEGMIHQVGFILLLLLMLFVTIRDFAHFKIFEKLTSFF